MLTSLFDQFFSQSTKKNSFLVEAIEPASAFVYKKAFNQNRLVWKLYPWFILYTGLHLIWKFL